VQEFAVVDVLMINTTQHVSTIT